MRVRNILGMVFALACLASPHAQAQSWPTRPVKIISPFAAGGAADTLGRLIADQLSSAFHQQFISPGTVSHGFLVGEYLAREERYQVRHIPDNGAGPALTDLIAGHVKLGTITFSTAAEQIRAGRVRALGVTTANRIPNFPDIPTFRELGQDLVAATWFALAGPAKLPRDIVQQLNRETLKAMQLPEVQKRLAVDAFETHLFSPEGVPKGRGAGVARSERLSS